MKCSFTEHEEINANIYCLDCKVYMCNKCEVFHSKLCKKHRVTKLEKIIKEIFTGFCKEEKHNIELEFFYKNHNELCCAACISKINNKGYGKHKDCVVVNVEDIKDEKLNKLKDNINLLEELSKTLEESTKKLKNFIEKINNSKEELKLKIQKIFTRIRNEINSREDFLLLEIDKKFENRFFSENTLKEVEKLPKKIKLSLEEGKSIDNENKLDKNLNSLIYRCINIENNIEEINLIKEKIKKSWELNNDNIKFIPEKEEINKFLNGIKNFGEIIYDEYFKLSSIINNNITKQNLIANWIKEKTNNNSVKFELIFKMSINGSKSKDFHKYCDNKGPTVTIVKTTKNKIFGGFTPLNWKDIGGNISDYAGQTFIFSLNLNKKFDMIKKGSSSLNFSNNRGPSFGNSDFKINENMREGITYANNRCSFFSNNNLELTGGNGEYEEFEVEELEVYKVL